MTQSDDNSANLQTPSEDPTRDKLIDSVVVMTAIYGAIAFTAIQARALEIGWTARDVVFLVVLIGLVVLAIHRKKLSAQRKAIIVIVTYLVSGVAGYYTLGMFAGGVFFFPMSAVIVALFYSTRVVAIFSFITLGFIGAIAAGFISGHIKLNVDSHVLVTSYAHWMVYVSAIAFFYIISCLAIVNYRRETNRLVTSLRSQQAILDKLAKIDALTDIPNRRSFDEYFYIQWQNASRTASPLSFIMIDVDHFKDFNDHYGHALGDACLKSVATSLATTINRPNDMVARYGGEEFVCLLPATDIDGAISIAESMRMHVMALSIPHENSATAPYVTISLGVASVMPDKDTTPARLMKMADTALYQAKNSGRNCVKRFDKS